MGKDRYFYEAREIGVKVWIDSFNFGENTSKGIGSQNPGEIKDVFITMPLGRATTILFDVSHSGKFIELSTLGAEWTMGKSTLRRTLLTFHNAHVSHVSASAETASVGLTFEKIDINHRGF
jgi:type VI protein secretion system component Hcp